MKRRSLQPFAGISLEAIEHVDADRHYPIDLLVEKIVNWGSFEYV